MARPLSLGRVLEELENETDEGERLGERDAEEHRGPHLAGHLGLAGHRLDGLADEETDADAGADGGEAVADRRRGRT